MQSTLTVVILIFASLNFCGFSKNHCNLWLIILSIKYFFRNISCQSFNEHLIFKFVDSTALSMNIVIQPILMKLKYYIFHNISNDGVMTQVFLPCDCWENSLGSINDKLPDFLIFIWPLLFIPSLPLTTTPPPPNTQLHFTFIPRHNAATGIYPTYLNINLPWYQTLAKISW